MNLARCGVNGPLTLALSHGGRGSSCDALRGCAPLSVCVEDAQARWLGVRYGTVPGGRISVRHR